MSALKHQTIAYQFTTATSFDGSTKPPVAAENGEAQFYEAAANELGMFPVNEPSSESAPGTSRGNRWLTWYELRLTAPAPAGSKIELVDNTSEDGVPVVLKELQADIAGETLVYVDVGTLIPQGAAIRVTAGVAGVFRYHVTFLEPQSLAMLASLTVSAQAGSDVSGESALVFSDEVATAAGAAPLSVDVIQRYDASALLADELILVLPANPAKDDRVGIKEVGNSAVSVSLLGNGSTVESATAAPAATQSVGIARQSLIWQFDGDGAWRVV